VYLLEECLLTLKVQGVTETSPWAKFMLQQPLYVNTLCSKKGATKLMAVTLSNLNRFSKFFHHRKEKEISNKMTYYFPPHLKYVAALPVGIQKFKFVVKLPNKIITRIIFVKKMKV